MFKKQKTNDRIKNAKDTRTLIKLQIRFLRLQLLKFCHIIVSKQKFISIILEYI